MTLGDGQFTIKFVSSTDGNCFINALLSCYNLRSTLVEEVHAQFQVAAQDSRGGFSIA